MQSFNPIALNQLVRQNVTIWNHAAVSKSLFSSYQINSIRLTQLHQLNVIHNQEFIHSFSTNISQVVPQSNSNSNLSNKSNRQKLSESSDNYSSKSFDLIQPNKLSRSEYYQKTLPLCRSILNIPSGMFSIWKPLGITSSYLVNQLKYKLLQLNENQKELIEKNQIKPKVLNRSLKIGCGGKLDLQAEGILVIAVNDSTKLLTNQLKNTRKTYLTTCRFGESTSTYDSTSSITAKKSYNHITYDMLLSAINSMTGEILSTPPNYSSLKIKGKTASDRVRNGEEIIMKPRKQFVYKFQIINNQQYINAQQDVEFEIETNSGTYIRSLCYELGQKLNTEAHMLKLQRIRQSDFTKEKALKHDATRQEIIDALKALNKQPLR